MASAAEVQRRMFDVIKAHDWDALRELYDPEYTYMGGDGVEHKGAEVGLEVAQTYTRAFPDLDFTTRAQFAPDDEVSILELTVRGTHEADLENIPATGKPFEMVLCNVIEVADGRIRREREYWDNMSLLRQLGVLDESLG